MIIILKPIYHQFDCQNRLILLPNFIPIFLFQIFFAVFLLHRPLILLLMSTFLSETNEANFLRNVYLNPHCE